MSNISPAQAELLPILSQISVPWLGVGRGRICLTSFNSPTPRNPDRIRGTRISEMTLIQTEL